MQARTTRSTYAGLFMVTLATLMYETLLTRIFSVTMWYHFAFMAISIAMFGMTVGALIVYLRPGWFPEENTQTALSLTTLLFSVTMIASFLVHLTFTNKFAFGMTYRDWATLALTYVVISVPFVFGGMGVCLALTRFPGQVSSLYAADLAGAALGCLAFLFTINLIDGPTTVIVAAGLAGLGAMAFSLGMPSGKTKKLIAGTAVALASLTVLSIVRAGQGSPFIRLKYIKGERAVTPLYEKWNSFSRITVDGEPYKARVNPGSGFSDAFPPQLLLSNWLSLKIDSVADTILLQYTGIPGQLEHLKYDIVNLAHYLRRGAKVFVIGVGAGRDVLSAVAFGQKSVTGVELNGAILDVLNRKFADYSGHLSRMPGVTLVNDEARSYLSRSRESYDVIQVSLIDTWAATAAGAFVLSENSLYTTQAWRIFIDHLTPDGILTFTRWHMKGRPAEMYRLVSLAAQALREQGVANPAEHLAVVVKTNNPVTGSGIGTLLLCRRPFSEQDLAILKNVVDQMGFETLLTPRGILDPVFATLTAGRDLDVFYRDLPVDITPPTDDRPFFFNMLRLKDITKAELYGLGGISMNVMAVVILGVLLVIVFAITFLCIIVPLLFTSGHRVLRGASPFLVFFASIGFGFILVEISQMQRLVLFLGHPTYSLSVVLFSLLLSSGVGSLMTGRSSGRSPGGRDSGLLMLLLVVLLLFGLLTPFIVNAGQGLSTPVRILLAMAILVPLGFFMGMAFPLGMKLASQRTEALTPWLWGVNGATSVCGSVLSVAISIAYGISFAFWMGFLWYVVAVVAFLWARRSREKPAG